jgi:hypothetical protein
MAENGRLPGKRERAAVALASGHSVRGAAGAVGIGERTLYRWRDDPAFAQRVRDLQAELVRRAVGRLSRAMPKAAVKLRKLLASESEKIQLAAAGKLLESGLKLRDQVDLEERLAALERQAAQRRERGP